MTKFEQLGINFLCKANCKAEADSTLERSCNICCSKGMRLDCERCAIARAHSLVVAALDNNVQLNNTCREFYQV